jgi:phosphoribosylamine--glycine ligase/phosphoribosylformylglycinamidine cyclo-ligase
MMRGMADCFRSGAPPCTGTLSISVDAAGLDVFAPDELAAQLESSKVWAKGFMQRQGIPTAPHQSYASLEAAQAAVANARGRIVIKATGPCDGVGAFLPTDEAGALGVLEDLFVHRKLGRASDEIVIEDFLEGEEIGLMTLCDGSRIMAMPASQVPKRRGEGDQGINTGGLGAVFPVDDIATPHVMAQIDGLILQPTLRGMQAEGTRSTCRALYWRLTGFAGLEFRGILCLDIMLTRAGPRLLEYNVRGGCPSTESRMALLSPDWDLAAAVQVRASPPDRRGALTACQACAQRRLDEVPDVRFQPGHAVSVALVSCADHPRRIQVGSVVTVDPLPDGVTLHPARLDASSTPTALGTVAGAYVATITATGRTLEEAVGLAYEGVDCVHYGGKTCRRDIGQRRAG